MERVLLLYIAVTALVCICRAADYGQTCTQNTDCTSNHQICNVTCACDTGYVENSTKNGCNEINECSSNPCLNQATCVDRVNSYQCNCVLGFTGTYCETNINECSSGPCQNQATCVDLVNSYQCNCLPGYTGTQCQTDINECSSGPCQNQTTCVDLVNSYQCNCRAGYTGTQCQTDINECSSGPCQNQATCVDLVNSYQCNCHAGYTGTQCQTDINECSSGPCQNQATCVDLVNSYQCNCLPGYTGTQCQTDINECSSGPCQNQATCVDLVNSYQCNCRAGYTGTQCQTDINECSSGPCQNQATCVDLVNSYQCNCRAGYTGTQCQTDINECSSGPCQNQATCVDLVNTYQCNCRAGYTGTQCQTDINECSSGPCQNQATCVDLVNSYQCNCRAGYTGTQCQTDINECISLPCLNGGTCIDRVNSFTCNCAFGYSNSICGSAELGLSCDTSTSCKDENAACTKGVCRCSTLFYDDNGYTSTGNCLPISELKVTGITFSQVETTQLTVSWTPPVGKTSFISGYKVEWKYTDSTSGGASKDLSTNTTTLSTLTPGKAYTVTIFSMNNNTEPGVLRYTSSSSQHAAKPNQVTSLDPINQETNATNGITVAWIAAEGVVGSYYIRLLDGINEIITANPIGSVTTAQLNPIPQLKNGYKYSVQIQTRSEIFTNQTNGQAFEPGESFSEIFKTLVKVPDSPTRLDCPDVSRKDQSIKLTWQAPANPNGDIVGYQVEMKDHNDQFIRSYNSTGTSVEYTVTGLSPGTGYRFYVYTLNEQYKSSSPAINGICETSAPLATPPRNLIVDNIESRLFSISWGKPEVIYSAENLGYVISVQLENQTCVREEVFKCSNCTKTVDDVYRVSRVCLTNFSTMKTSSDLEDLQKYTISNLTPDTQYSVSVAAINYAGKGNTADKTIRTKEEVPQKPKCSLSNILAKSVNVTWTIGEPRPGQTTYTVQTTGAYPAANQTLDVPGFTNRSMEVNQLEEFWNYSIVVKAATSLGSNTSDPCTMQTLPTAPGIVDAFNIMTAPGGDYTRIKVQWKAPTELNRNSIIKGYNFTHNATDISDSGTKFVEEVDISVLKERIVEVVPETTYNFEVVAVNVLDQYGAPTKQVIFAPAVPKDVNNAALIGGVVGGVGGALIVIAIVALILWRRKKALPAMKKSKEDNEENFENLASETAKIKRKRPIQLDGIAEYVDNMHKDSNLLFSSEYDDVKTLSAKHVCEAAEREENRLKNRYINIIPFDHSRVKLTTNGEDESSDYINANYLPGYSSPREYIGCQGPIPGTIDDFWRMVWEQNAAVIVMLTLCKEGQKIKCEQYWPDEVGEPKQYGEVIVEITSYSNIRTYDYRMFKITMGNKSRVIKHFHFLSWLDFQANVHHDIILDFIKQVRQHVQPPDRSGPMVIHCSAGVGRTGTYICLDHLMQFVAEHDFNVDVDIFDMVLKLRENRMHMVQTEQQYVFIHDCLKEIVERKRNEDTYVNQGFCDDNIYQNEESLYQNVQNNQQKTEL